MDLMTKSSVLFGTITAVFFTSVHICYIGSLPKLVVMSVWAYNFLINGYAYMWPEFAACFFSEHSSIFPSILVSIIDIYMIIQSSSLHLFVTWVSPLVTMLITSQYTHFLTSYFIRSLILLLVFQTRRLIRCHELSEKMAIVSKYSSTIELQRKRDLFYHKLNLTDVDSE